MEDIQLTIGPSDYSLLTDLYQLTMGACYAGVGLDTAPASFELFARRLPAGFGYAIAMGLTQAVDYLEKWQFSSTQLDALRSTGIFEEAPASFWSMLADGQFSGDVWAVPEGTAVFPNEPLLRVEAQAQLVETYLLNTINYQTLCATKSARMRMWQARKCHFWSLAPDGPLVLKLRFGRPGGVRWHGKLPDSNRQVPALMAMG